MRAYIPYSLITFSPSNTWFDRACSSAISDREGAHHIKLLLLSSLMLPLFLLGIAVLLSFVGLVHLSVIGKLISSTLLLLKNVSGPYPKKIKNFCNSSFPSFIHPDGSIAYSPTDKANLFGSYFSANSSLSDSNAPDPLLNPSLTLYPPSSSLLAKFAGCFVL